MRLAFRLFTFLLVGCSSADAWAPVGDSGAPSEDCVGQGVQGSDTTTGAETWTTEVRDTELRRVSLIVWQDERRTRRSARYTWAYDEDGFLTEAHMDGNGDGRFESSQYWERADDTVVGLYIEEDWSGLSRSSLRITSTYVTDLLMLVESDYGADGTIEHTQTHTYEDRRPVRLESRYFASIEEVTTWTYLEPAPALDHFEEVDDSGDGIPEAVHTRRYDDRSRMVWWAIMHGDTVYQTNAYEWDDHDQVIRIEQTTEGVPLTVTYSWENGQLVLERVERPLGTVYLRQQFYDERGLPIEYYSEYDELGDGVVESSSYQRWEWVCP